MKAIFLIKPISSKTLNDLQVKHQKMEPVEVKKTIFYKAIVIKGCTFAVFQSYKRILQLYV